MEWLVQRLLFRSILELSYLKYLLDNNIKFESGELKKHVIKYKLNDNYRNYFTDFFIIDKDLYIEIKPKALVKSFVNKEKFKYAKDKLKNRFIILTEDDFNILSTTEIINLYNNEEIFFTKKYDKKFKEIYNVK